MKPPRCPSAIRRRTWADSRLLGAAPGAAIGLAPEARALAGRLGGGLGLAPVLVGPVGLVGLLGLFQLLTCLLDLARRAIKPRGNRSEEHTSELQSHSDLVCRLLLEKKKQ